MFSALLPGEGTKTLWEDCCILVHYDDAKDLSGSPKLLPSILLAEDLPAELLPQRAAVYPPADASGDCGEDGSGRASIFERLSNQLQAALRPLAPTQDPLTFVWRRFLSGCQPRAVAPPLEWHPRQPLLLAAADRRGRVQLIDLAPSLTAKRHNQQQPYQQHQLRGHEAAAAAAGGGGGPCVEELLLVGPAAAGGGSGGGGVLKAVLSHEALQNQALSLAWSPTSPGLLAVGSAGAVGLWALAGEARPPLAAAGRSSGPWLRLLRTRVAAARVTSLSWDPNGRLMAAASPDQAGLQVWDVASGSSTAVGAGPAAFDRVHWSPCGNYVFAAGTGSRHFYIFETERWRWARWQTGSSTAPASATTAVQAGGGNGGSDGDGSAAAAASVVAAAWAPSVPGRNPILLMALYGQSYLVAVHLVDSPPGLTAQLLPVALPELHRGAPRGSGAGANRSDGGGGLCAAPPSSSSSGAAVAVADLAWDARGERLAVLLAPGPLGQETHCVAVYGTITDPLVSARLIGLARPPLRLREAAAEAAAAAAAARGDGKAAGSSVQKEGPAETETGAAAAAAARPASIVARPGCLAAARLAPLGAAGGASAAGAAAPSCVISARVGERGIYNLPCYL